MTQLHFLSVIILISMCYLFLYAMYLLRSMKDRTVELGYRPIGIIDKTNIPGKCGMNTKPIIQKPNITTPNQG